ncbi:NAD(P)-binding protein [Sporormia fimetaria CBS 119925]|uniref:NAD(P)-binding protein n=1 Tax=Sporormia fimetaria CBS 119925 TaxID=1340428 RepID=A0A6A6VCI9_9PLEO|nr:NAD(P)-binding protein [Sporormia fimetaria CBS 119925]
MSSFPAFLKSQLFYTPRDPLSTDPAFAAGKTIIVTGANTGLGLEATKCFVRGGAQTVIIACRNLSKGEAAKHSIEESENSKGVLQVWELDLSSYASVKAFAKRCETIPRLDSVVLNAGIATGRFQRVEGHEAHIAVNVISTFMLGLLLLPILRRSAATTGSRPFLTIVTSEMHFWTTLPQKKSPNIFAALDQEKGADMMDRYNVSKLLQILVVRHLTRVVIGDRFRYPVVVNCVTPGLCRSELVKDMGLTPVVFKKLLGRTVEMGGRALVNAAGGLVGKESAGEYIADDRISEPSPLVRSEEGAELAKRVWEELVPILERECPGIVAGIAV